MIGDGDTYLSSTTRSYQPDIFLNMMQSHGGNYEITLKSRSWIHDILQENRHIGRFSFLLSSLYHFPGVIDTGNISVTVPGLDQRHSVPATGSQFEDGYGVFRDKRDTT